MNLDEILTEWRQWKGRFGGRRLDAPSSIEHEYKGKQWGHPSTYAFVRFECAPAEHFVFEMRAKWPAQVTVDDCRLVHDAMSAAIVDVLAAAEEPHLGCSVICVEVKWDDVGSSAMAFYRATRVAMTTLRDGEKWSLVLKEKQRP